MVLVLRLLELPDLAAVEQDSTFLLVPVAQRLRRVEVDENVLLDREEPALPVAATKEARAVALLKEEAAGGGRGGGGG